jgi:GNAT superfamily N-acetyltransferase
MEAAFTLQVQDTYELGAEIRAEIIQMCEEAHQVEFQKLFDYLPRDGRHVLGYWGETLAAHAVRTTRWAQPAGLPPLKTAYIDAVTTRVDLQGQGLGSAVMRRIVEVIAQEDYLLSALDTDKPGFYTRLGWVVWPGPLGGRGEQGLIPTPESQGHVLVYRLPNSPAFDLNSLLTIEDQGRIW